MIYLNINCRLNQDFIHRIPIRVNLDYKRVIIHKWTTNRECMQNKVNFHYIDQTNLFIINLVEVEDFESLSSESEDS